MGIRKENLGLGFAGIGFGLISFGQGLTEIIPEYAQPFFYFGVFCFLIGLIFHTTHGVRAEGNRNYKNFFEAFKSLSTRGPHPSFNKKVSLLQIVIPSTILVLMTLVLILYYPTEGVMFSKWGTILFFALPFGYGLACLFNVIKITYPS